jgi:hypothetical protein
MVAFPSALMGILPELLAHLPHERADSHILFVVESINVARELLVQALVKVALKRFVAHIFPTRSPGFIAHA